MPSPTSWGPESSVSPTGNPFLNGLLGGAKWGGGVGQGVTLTYSFPQDGSLWSTDPTTGYGPQNGNGDPWDDFFAGSTLAEMAIIRSALRGWSMVANINFVEVADNATTVGEMRFGFTTDRTAHAFFPEPAAYAGDVWFGRHLDGLGARGSYAFTTVLHEIGHAVGLKHPHEAVGGFNALPVNWDSMEFSVMSYRSYVGAPVGGGYRNETWGHAQTPMIYDIQTIQHLYGANFSTNSGNTVYQWSTATGEAFVNGIGRGAPGGNRVFETIWDGGGVDTYDFSNYATNLSINLGPGGWSLISDIQRANLGDGHFARGNVYNAFQHRGDPRSLIENAKGGIGNDLITGNAGRNSLIGNGGSDTLNGLSGNDSLSGGSGRDVLVGGLGRDLLVGGAQADVFDFNSIRESSFGAKRDVVTFVRADGDRLDLRGIDADIDGTGGNQAFRWIGSKAFSGADGQLRFSGGILSGDVDGDRRADFEIKIVGALSVADVIL